MTMHTYIMSTILIINSICTIQASENYTQLSDTALEELHNKECDDFARNDCDHTTAFFKHSKCFFKRTGCPIEHNNYLGDCENCAEIAVRIFMLSDKLEENINTLQLIRDEQKERHLPTRTCWYNSSSTFVKLYGKDKQLQTKSVSDLLEKEKELQNKHYDTIYAPNNNRFCKKEHDCEDYEHEDEMEDFKNLALCRNRLKQQAIKQELENRLNKYPLPYRAGLLFMHNLAKHEYNNWKFE